MKAQDSHRFRRALPLIASIFIAPAAFGLGRWCFDEVEPDIVPAPAAAPPKPESLIVTDAVAKVSQPKPTREELRVALQDKDVFRASKVAVAWIEGATLDDLRAFASDPKRFPRIYVAGFDDEFQKAFEDAFVERWLTLAPDDLARIGKANDPSRSFIRTAARVKPELVLTHHYTERKSDAFANLTGLAFESLAKRDIAAARRMLAEAPSATARQSLELSILQGLAEADVFSALALLPAKKKEGPDPGHAGVVTAIVEAAERSGVGALRNVFAEAGGKLDEYPGLPRLMLRYPDLVGDLAARSTVARSTVTLDENLLADADRTTPEVRRKVLADFEKLPAAGRDQLCAALATSWAREDPRAAADWALAHSQPEDASSPSNLAARYVLTRWVNSDPRAAFRWWQSLPNSEMRDAIGTEVSTWFAEDDDFEKALTLFRPSSDKFGAGVTEHFASLYAKHDPAAAAVWLAGQPQVAINHEWAVTSVASRYYQADPAAAVRWAENLGPGMNRDFALKSIVRKSAAGDPQRAAEWVAKISEPKIRSDAALDLAFAWKFIDREAMRVWLQGDPGLNENWRAHFLAE